MIEQLMTNGGAYIGEEVQSERDFIGRDRISITVEESYLQQIWTRLDADLQDALSLAGNQVLREGGEAIALAHLGPAGAFERKHTVPRVNNRT